LDAPDLNESTGIAGPADVAVAKSALFGLWKKDISSAQTCSRDECGAKTYTCEISAKIKPFARALKSGLYQFDCPAKRQDTGYHDHRTGPAPALVQCKDGKNAIGDEVVQLVTGGDLMDIGGRQERQNHDTKSGHQGDFIGMGA
jgi:hypothetical protein